MKVYRICDRDEIEKILATEKFDEVGQLFENNEKFSSHKYKPDTKYLHFFQDISGIFYLDTSQDRCVCTYEIPDHILQECRGYGYYLDYVKSKERQLVPEFAVDVNQLNFGYLIKVEQLIQDINYLALYFNPYFKGITQTLYYNDFGSIRRVE